MMANCVFCRNPNITFFGGISFQEDQSDQEDWEREHYVCGRNVLDKWADF